jgi:hypothetical protein
VHGDLTPECAEAVGRVLDALGAPVGAEDDRTRDQRYHDALQEALRRLIAAGLLPERAGQPVKAWVHISLADLMLLDADSALQDQWTAHVREQWAARRAFASETGSEGGAWLDGDAAEAVACDAAMAPIVTGDVNIDALEDLVRLCVELDARRRDGARDAAWAAVERAVIGKAIDLLSGPGGLASFLRRRQLGARLGGPSLPLDIGYSENVPAGIRNAVLLRDRRCRWAGGCNQPASACEVHHTKHKKNGGPTSATDCVLLCAFHHQIAIHRWGWTLVLNPDGTTTAWNKDKTRTRPRSSTATGHPSNRVTAPVSKLTRHRGKDHRGWAVAAQAVALTSKGPSGSFRRHRSRSSFLRSADSDVRYAPAGPTPRVNVSHHESNPGWWTWTVSVVTSISSSPACANSSAR